MIPFYFLIIIIIFLKLFLPSNTFTHQASAANIGFVVVDELTGTKCRFHHGTIIDASINYAHDVQTIQCYATCSVQGFPLYQRRGFVTANKHLGKLIILVYDELKKQMVVNNIQEVKLKSFEAD